MYWILGRDYETKHHRRKGTPILYKEGERHDSKQDRKTVQDIFSQDNGISPETVQGRQAQEGAIRQPCVLQSEKMMNKNQFISTMLFLSVSLYGTYLQWMSIPNLKTVLIIGVLNIFYTIGWLLSVFYVDWNKTSKPETTHNNDELELYPDIFS